MEKLTIRGLKKISLSIQVLLFWYIFVEQIYYDMKKYPLLLFMITLSFSGFGQIKVLFVNDNKPFLDNTDVVRNALQSVGSDIIELREYDAVVNGVGPSVELMQAHDLVIWYTSTDGVDLWLWNGNDTEPEGLKSYLDEGGMLLLMGNDFLFDKYQLPPKDFVEGDFVYDYLGIQTYEAQSFGNDLGVGVPQMDFVENLFIENLPSPLRWVFETLWWVDAVVPNDFGIPIYQMGPQSYALAGKPSGVLLRSTPNNFFPVISLYFDPALIQTATHRNQLMAGLMNYFRDFKLSVRVEETNKSKIQYTLYPNPAGDQIWLSFKNKTDLSTTSAPLSIINPLGQVVYQSEWSFMNSPFQIPIQQFASGLYWILIDRNGSVDSVPFVKK